MDAVVKEAVRRVEQSGIIFLDELDKIAGRERSSGPDVSREGVQRDLLPIIEGSTVNTKYGMVKTDHILFIAAGAFHVSKPSDLIPELQGRFPIRVELQSLGKDDFIRILREPRNALLKQYRRCSTPRAWRWCSVTTPSMNWLPSPTASISRRKTFGARRLYTILERLLDDLSFRASDMTEAHVTIDRQYVTERLEDIVSSEDITRYIL